MVSSRPILLNKAVNFIPNAVRASSTAILLNQAVNFTPEYELTYFLSHKSITDQIMLDLSRWQEKAFVPILGEDVYNTFLDIVSYDTEYEKLHNSKTSRPLIMKREQIVSSIIAHEKVCKDSLSVESFLKDREMEFSSLFDGIDLVDLYVKAFKNLS
jgi:hypothetical protein